MNIRILVNGANGKMGKVTAAAIEETNDLTLVAQTGKTDNLAKAIETSKAQVVVDFTIPNSVFENCQTIIQCNASPVIGTTGLTLEQIHELTQQCAAKSLGGVIAPNFSIGAVLMMRFSELAAHYFENNEIIEFHHPYKLDSPSGTAKKTAEMMRATMQTAKRINVTHDSARGEYYQDIPIHSVRIPGVFAQQMVVFGGEGETLTIHHDATDRRSMMQGVLLACRRVRVLNHLVYGLDKLLQ